VATGNKPQPLTSHEQTREPGFGGH